MSDYESDRMLNIPLSAVLNAEQILLRGITYTPRKDQYNQLEMILADFTPRGQTKAQWIRECQDVMIQGYIDNDNVFRRALCPEDGDLGPEEHRLFALYEGLHHATMNGLWQPEYQKLLNLTEEDEDEHEEGGI